MQGIYTYIPETNYVPREYSVAAILLLLFMVLISLVPVLDLLYFYISTFRSMCAATNMAVFWSSLTHYYYHHHHHRLLVIMWRSSGKPRPQQEIRSIYPNTSREISYYYYLC